MKTRENPANTSSLSEERKKYESQLFSILSGLDDKKEEIASFAKELISRYGETACNRVRAFRIITGQSLEGCPIIKEPEYDFDEKIAAMEIEEAVGRRLEAMDPAPQVVKQRELTTFCRQASREGTRASNEFAKKLEEKYGREQCRKKRLFHVLLGSTIDRDFGTNDDFPGEDSIEQFIHELPRSYPKDKVES